MRVWLVVAQTSLADRRDPSRKEEEGRREGEEKKERNNKCNASKGGAVLVV